MGKLEEDLRENKDLRLEIMKFTGHQWTAICNVLSMSVCVFIDDDDDDDDDYIVSWERERERWMMSEEVREREGKWKQEVEIETLYKHGYWILVFLWFGMNGGNMMLKI
jgi:hypothetical protein